MAQLSSALLFPETEPSVNTLATLLFFSHSITFYLPTESDTAGSGLQSSLRNLCTAFVPAPLHEDLHRFNRLLREMETCTSDDLVRLFSATRIPVVKGQIRDKDEATCGNVFTTLQRETDKQIFSAYKERLWQARLILKLAELLDRREKDVRHGLAQISASEQKILAALDGSNDIDPDEIDELSGFGVYRPSTRKKSDLAEFTLGLSALLAPLRIKAWAELFLADTRPHRPLVLVAGNNDYGSVLLDGYENIWRRNPQKLFTLSLPSFYGRENNTSSLASFIRSRDKLGLAARPILEYFEKILRETAHPVKPHLDSRVTVQTEYPKMWNDTLESTCPPASQDYKALDFYCLPGISSTSLLSRLFHLESLSPALSKENQSTILAILKD